MGRGRGSRDAIVGIRLGESDASVSLVGLISRRGAEAGAGTSSHIVSGSLSGGVWNGLFRFEEWK